MNPIAVPGRISQFNDPNQCFGNVHRMVLGHGGKMRFGWLKGLITFPERPLIQQWVHHAVWEAPDGSLRDLTPQVLPENHSVAVMQPVSYFAPDDAATLVATNDGRWQSRSPVYQALVDEPNVPRGIRYLKVADDKVRNGDFKGEAYWCARAGQVLGGWIHPMGIKVMIPFSFEAAVP